MSVLIAKKAALGDVLRTTSLLPALKRRFGGPVWWITDKAARPLLEGHPAVDRVLTSGENLRRRFDLALSLEEDADCARWSAAAGEDLVGVTLRADGSLGYTKSAEPYYGMSLLREGRAEADRLKAANRRSFASLWHGILGLPVQKKPGPAIFLSPAEKAAGLAVLARLGVKKGTAIGLNAGAGSRWPSKQLSEEAAVGLARALSALGPVVLLGGKEEEARNKRIAAAALCVAMRPMPLRLFAGLVAGLRAVVTTDTLALHVSAAVGRPTVALVGPTSAAELDLGARGAVLTPKRGCACFYAAKCRRERHCLEEIEPSRALAALRRLS